MAVIHWQQNKRGKIEPSPHLPSNNPTVHDFRLLHKDPAHQTHREDGHAGRGSNLFEEVQGVGVVVISKVHHAILVLRVLSG